MKKRILSVVMAAVLSAAMLVGCGGSSSGTQTAEAEGNAEETTEEEAPANGGETELRRLQRFRNVLERPA